MSADLASVDIICATYNGARFLPELLDSLGAQSHARWRLWIRDDGSTDATVAAAQARADRDERIHIIDDAACPERLGAARSFGRLLSLLPDDSQYVMCADQDDVWLPHKVERTLAAMRAAEATDPSAPVLVHTDLLVTDDALRVLHPSFWSYARLEPEPATVRRLAVQNIVTGATAMLNRPLRMRVGAAPAGVAFHDWWYALVAAAFGRVVAVAEPTILYRQHGANVVGARDARLSFRQLPGAIAARLATRDEFRADLRQAATQARTFLDRYGSELAVEDRAFLTGFAGIPDQRLVRRKLALLRYRVQPRTGVLRTLGVLWRG